MANTLYDRARKAFAKAEINWETDDIRVALVTAAYVYDATHTSMASISAGQTVPPSGSSSLQYYYALDTTTGSGYGVQTNGAVDADDATFTSVAAGTAAKAILIYKYVDATPGNCPVIAYLDSATGLPITPNGGDIIITWDNGTNKIFRL